MKNTLLESKNFRVVRAKYESASAGTDAVIEYIEQPNVVIAVPVMANGDVILVEHLRPILRTTLLECPGGKVDPDEDLEQCIVRELQEEIGYTARTIEYLCYFFTSVGTSTEKIHVFVASDLGVHSRKKEDIKRMVVKPFKLSEIPALLDAERILDAKTEVALYKYLHRVGRVKIS